MAMLASLPGVTVSILTTDSPDPLTEYRCDEDAANVPVDQRHKTTTNFVQSSPDKIFAFKLNIDPSYKLDCPMLAFAFIINGIDGGSPQLYHPKWADKDGCWEEDVWGWQVRRGGQKKLIQFKFAALKTNEDSPDHLPGEELELLSKLGVVKVEINRVRGSQVPKEREEDDEILNPIPEISEKVVKGLAISHTVHLEVKSSDEETPLQEIEYLDLDGDNNPVPIAVFRFKYRSKEDLQKTFIIPRSPSLEPPPERSQRVFEDLKIRDINNFARAGHDKREWARKELCRDRGEKFVAITFKQLSKDEKRKLARSEFESMNGEPTEREVKTEPSRAGFEYALVGQKIKRAPKEFRNEDGKVLIDLVDNDEDEGEVQAPAPAVACRNVDDDDDDVVFMSAKSIQNARAKRSNAARCQVKNED